MQKRKYRAIQSSIRARICLNRSQEDYTYEH